MRFRKTHQEGGDCTAPYDIENYHKKVADFVGEVLNTHNNEWGYFEIDGCKFEYKYGEMLELIPSSVLVKTITDAKAVGGYTWMSYYIKTSTPPPRPVFMYKNPFKK